MSWKYGSYLLEDYDDNEEFDEFDELEKFGKISVIEEIPQDVALIDFDEVQEEEDEVK